MVGRWWGGGGEVVGRWWGGDGEVVGGGGGILIVRGEGGEVGIRRGGRWEVEEVGRGITVYLASSYNTTYLVQGVQPAS